MDDPASRPEPPDDRYPRSASTLTAVRDRRPTYRRTVAATALAMAALSIWAAAALGGSAFSPDAMRISLRSEPTTLNDGIFWTLMGLVTILAVFVVVQWLLRRRDLGRMREKSLEIAVQHLRRKAVDEGLVEMAVEYFQAHAGIDAENAVRVASTFDQTLSKAWREAVGDERVATARKQLFQVTGGGGGGGGARLAAAVRDAASGSVRASPPKRTSTRLGDMAGASVSGRSATSGRKILDNDVWGKLPWLTPGRLVQVSRDRNDRIAGVVMRASPTQIDLAMAPETRLAVGLSVEVMVDIGRSLCCLAAKVQESAPGPTPMVRLGGFDEAWQARRRNHTRLRMAKAVRFGHWSVRDHEDDGDLSLAAIQEHLAATADGYLWDLGLGGCCLSTMSPGDFAAGDFIQFSLPLSSGSEPLRLIGSVVGVSRGAPDEGGRRLHLQYLPLDEASENALAAAVRQWTAAIQ